MAPVIIRPLGHSIRSTRKEATRPNVPRQYRYQKRFLASLLRNAHRTLHNYPAVPLALEMSYHPGILVYRTQPMAIMGPDSCTHCTWCSGAVDMSRHICPFLLHTTRVFVSHHVTTSGSKHVVCLVPYMERQYTVPRSPFRLLAGRQSHHGRNQRQAGAVAGRRNTI